MAFDQDEWDEMAADCVAELGHVTVVLSQAKTAGSPDPATKLYTGGTVNTTAAIRAMRGPLQTRRAAGPGEKGQDLVQFGRWVIPAASVVNAGDSVAFGLRVNATLVETDGAGDARTFYVTTVTPEMGGTDLAVEAQRRFTPTA